jgi:hypothetical protein
VYAAAASDPNTSTYDEAMCDLAHLDQWKAAAAAEIQTFERMGTWTELPQSDACNSKILPGTWAFCHKRTPDGKSKKFKAHYCVR